MLHSINKHNTSWNNTLQLSVLSLSSAEQQASGQGAAHGLAEHSAQGRKPGAQEAEGRVPGMSCHHSGGPWLFHFCIETGLYIFFLIVKI